MKKKKKRVFRKATPKESADYRNAVREEAGMEANQALGRDVFRQREQATAVARQTLNYLAEIKEQKGLSFRDLARATGMERSNLVRLFNHPAPNTTVDTLSRVANAMGASIEIAVVEN